MTREEKINLLRDQLAIPGNIRVLILEIFNDVSANMPEERIDYLLSKFQTE